MTHRNYNMFTFNGKIYLGDVKMIDNNLKYCREELEMTQKELGYVFGVSESTVSGWENNHDTMPLNKMIKFANMYHYSLDYICGLTRKNNYIKLDKMDKVKIGKKLKEIRIKLGLTQKDISSECSISQTTYSNYETGLYLITSLSLYIICKEHNLSMDQIVK